MWRASSIDRGGHDRCRARARLTGCVLYRAGDRAQRDGATGRAPRTDLNAALAIEPDRPELLNYLGYGWINRGERMAEGLALIKRAAEARPDQGYILDSLGWAYFQPRPV